ncbi:hypothetical protein MMC26_000737 [Xylographa opegraphella]|nr:hypothetical protein [Xylographa opegraphella]
MPPLPPLSSGIYETSARCPNPSQSSIINSLPPYSTPHLLANLIIASAIVLVIFLYWYKRRKPRFSMSQYPSMLEKSFGRSSPPPSATRSYPSYQPSSQRQNYGSDPPPPAPTIRRQSEPFGTASPESAGGQKAAGTSPEPVADRQQPLRLPPPWVPGRTDTFVRLNGCRRHVMVIEGHPLRRGTA